MGARREPKRTARSSKNPTRVAQRPTTSAQLKGGPGRPELNHHGALPAQGRPARTEPNPKDRPAAALTRSRATEERGSERRGRTAGPRGPVHARAKRAPETQRGPEAQTAGRRHPHLQGGTWGGTTTPTKLDRRRPAETWSGLQRYRTSCTLRDDSSDYGRCHTKHTNCRNNRQESTDPWIG
jgi:hypothetical protein